jgi:hypothetical protein
MVGERSAAMSELGYDILAAVIMLSAVLMVTALVYTAFL